MATQTEKVNRVVKALGLLEKKLSDSYLEWAERDRDDVNASKK